MGFPKIELKNTAIFLLLMGVLLAQPLAALSDPLGTAIPARPIALGGAYVGLANDGAAIFLNPAGLARIKEPNFTTLFSQPMTDISNMIIGGAWPQKWGGALAAGYRNRTTANVQISSETTDYVEQDLTLLFAKELLPQLSLGGDLRLISRSLGKDVTGYEGLNGSGTALDLGLKYTPFSWLAAGLGIRNLGGVINYRGGRSDNITVNTTAGICFKAWAKDGFWPRRCSDLTLLLDVTKSEFSDILQWHSGGEWSPLPNVALRLGLDQTPNGLNDNFTNFTAGFGLNLKGITFDYAYKKWNDSTQNISHYFSLGYTEPPPVCESDQRPAPTSFPDVPDNHWAQKPILALTALGLMDYYPDGTFRPDQPSYRAETVKLLVKDRELPLPKEKKQVFYDVPTDFWAADYIQAAYENKIAKGFPDKTFKPRNPTSRAEAVTFLTRFDNAVLKDVEVLPFPDLKNDHWALKEILAAQEEGLLEYLSGKDFKPSDSLTRAELAEILFKTNYIQGKMK